MDYNVWLQWHFHPDIVVGVVLLQGFYILSITVLSSRYNLAPTVDKRKTFLFTMGVLFMYIALSSPIHHLADNYLFSAHMVQHLILLLLVPPLLLTGTPEWMWRPIVRYRLTRHIANWLTRPVQAFAISGLILALWHLPPFYNATLTSHTLHVIEHIMFILSAIIMWWPVLSPVIAIPRASYPMQMVYLFLLTLPAGFIGAAITFSPRILYDFYATVPRLWALDVVTDQQIGGLIMKIPGALAFFITMIFVFSLWYQRDNRSGYSSIIEIEPPEEDK